MPQPHEENLDCLKSHEGKKKKKIGVKTKVLKKQNKIIPFENYLPHV